jgi:hypothetical protein
VTEPRRRERTAKLLSAHLDAIAQGASGIPHGETERLIERAAVATMRAVALELLEPGRAVAIWQEAQARYPSLPQRELELPTAPVCLAA